MRALLPRDGPPPPLLSSRILRCLRHRVHPTLEGSTTPNGSTIRSRVYVAPTGDPHQDLLARAYSRHLGPPPLPAPLHSHAAHHHGSILPWFHHSKWVHHSMSPVPHGAIPADLPAYGAYCFSRGPPLAGPLYRDCRSILPRWFHHFKRVHCQMESSHWRAIPMADSSRAYSGPLARARSPLSTVGRSLRHLPATPATGTIRQESVCCWRRSYRHSPATRPRDLSLPGSSLSPLLHPYGSAYPYRDLAGSILPCGSTGEMELRLERSIRSGVHTTPIPTRPHGLPVDLWVHPTWRFHHPKQVHYYMRSQAAPVHPLPDLLALQFSSTPWAHPWVHRLYRPTPLMQAHNRLVRLRLMGPNPWDNFMGP
ncbi:hypothetical protein FNV43_RR08891 [Rhamnella rubrinervis]|uniref:Uncharacterized protein n=1 Tax=Rhamnella rubrinervis TaxID=2594499 RepID=A0A8K0H9G7_9ROSA|nr:hypothetical protein FNV43_RR08891 [Rhamnella rubrinervis]